MILFLLSLFRNLYLIIIYISCKKKKNTAGSWLNLLTKMFLKINKPYNFSLRVIFVNYVFWIFSEIYINIISFKISQIWSPEYLWKPLRFAGNRYGGQHINFVFGKQTTQTHTLFPSWLGWSFFSAEQHVVIVDSDAERYLHFINLLAPNFMALWLIIIGSINLS